jgi:hypothetical protein
MNYSAPARREGIPLVPDRSARNEAAVRSLTRAAIATGVASFDSKQIHPQAYARDRWQDDHVAGMVLRAAVTPASLAGNAALARVSLAFLETLVPVSAGADLLRRGLGLDFDGAASIRVPGISVPTADFVGEGAPIPAPLIATSSGPSLSVFKIAALSSLTREMMESSNAEAMVRQVLIESTGPALDRTMFSANAAAADRPAGLLHNIAALTPAAGTSGKDQIIVDDLQALVAAIAPVAGISREPYVIAVHPSVPAKTVPEFIAYANAVSR